ncbi:hypothetical protein MED297_07906 [Reinekea sp. MED297]|uniref:Questin oxidase family protein n=2 Tax=Reinekea TaxID=230494 RepID=A4BCR4_9GAMM|nr:hypothetical protein MED297_07906 [Reinekea sp. MED297] [Reinekea blandensis MED297]
MVISALRELGATKAHLQRYQALMAPKIRPMDAPECPIANDAQLLDWRGRRENYGGVFEYLSGQYQTLGLQPFLNHYLPMLAEGISGGAFHPLIRLGHAVHDRNDREVVAATAYWVWAYQALAYPSSDKPIAADPGDVLESLLNDQNWPEHPFEMPTITEAFEQVVNHPDYAALRFQITPDSLSFQRLNQLAIDLFWMHDDFTLLHGVTGMLAIGRVRRWLADERLLLEPMWRALVVAWLSTGLRWQPAEEPSSLPSLSLMQLRTLAAHGTRDHTVKLVAACLANFRKTERALYLHAAEREVLNDTQLQAMI